MLIRGIDKALKKLLRQKFVLKNNRYDDNNQKTCTYTINFSKVEDLGLTSITRELIAAPRVQKIHYRGEKFPRTG